MLGGANHIIDADLIARAVVASARTYGDDPIRALTAKRGYFKRAVQPAVEGLAKATGEPNALFARLLGVHARNVSRARTRGRAGFARAAAAAEAAARYALWRPESRESAVVEASTPWATADAPIKWPVFEEPPTLGSVTAATPREAPVEIPPPVVTEANAVRVSPPAAEVVPLRPASPPRPAVQPERRPYSPERPRPAPAAPPRPRPAASGRKAPRGASVERLPGGVEIIRVKPITDRMLGHIRAQVENGLDVAEAADLFDVDLDSLTAKLQAAGVRL